LAVVARWVHVLSSPGWIAGSRWFGRGRLSAAGHPSRLRQGGATDRQWHRRCAPRGGSACQQEQLADPRRQRRHSDRHACRVVGQHRSTQRLTLHRSTGRGRLALGDKGLGLKRHEMCLASVLGHRPTAPSRFMISGPTRSTSDGDMPPPRRTTTRRCDGTTITSWLPRPNAKKVSGGAAGHT
jgi:hypothetical protein